MKRGCSRDGRVTVRDGPWRPTQERDSRCDGRKSTVTAAEPDRKRDRDGCDGRDDQKQVRTRAREMRKRKAMLQGFVKSTVDSEFPFQIVCPVCGYECAHFDSREGGVVKRLAGRDDPDPEIDTRQGGYRVFFQGECDHRFALDLGEHKGYLFCRWVELKEQT